MMGAFLGIVFGMPVPFDIAWLLHSIIEHREDTLFADFYQKYGERRTAEIVSLEEANGRSHKYYYLTLRFTDDTGRCHTAHLKTAHPSARQYVALHESEFLCLYGAVKARDAFQYLDEHAPDGRAYPLHGIPLAVIPAEEDFVRCGRISRLKGWLIVHAFFLALGLALLIGEQLSPATLQQISEAGWVLLPVVCIVMVIGLIVRLTKRRKQKK